MSNNKVLVAAVVALIVPVIVPSMAEAQHPSHAMPPPEPAFLLQSVRILDGTGPLSAPSNVLIRGNRIVKISTAPITVEPRENTVTLPQEGANVPVMAPATNILVIMPSARKSSGEISVGDP